MIHYTHKLGNKNAFPNVQYVRSFSMPKTKKHSLLLWAKVIKELIKSRLEWQTTMSGRTVPITQSKETLSIQFLCRVTNTNPVYEITLYSPGLDKEICHNIYIKNMKLFTSYLYGFKKPKTWEDVAERNSCDLVQELNKGHWFKLDVSRMFVFSSPLSILSFSLIIFCFCTYILAV